MAIPYLRSRPIATQLAALGTAPTKKEPGKCRAPGGLGPHLNGGPSCTTHDAFRAYCPSGTAKLPLGSGRSSRAPQRAQAQAQSVLQGQPSWLPS